MPKLGYRMTDEQKQNISDGMKKHHKKKDVTYRKIKAPDRGKIAELYNSGRIPVYELARMFGISVKHLYTILDCVEGD